MALTILHKRGDSFSKVISLPADLESGYFAGWTIAAQLRTESGTFVDTIATAWLDDPVRKNISLVKLDTTRWKIADLELDIQFTRTSDGFATSTDTIIVSVQRDVTILP